MLVYFVDPISMEWDEQSGFPIKFAKEWVTQAMPYVQVSHWGWEEEGCMFNHWCFLLPAYVAEGPVQY